MATNSPSKSRDDKSGALELAESAVSKQFGEGTLFRLGDQTRLNIERLSSGNLAIDIALGGGFPKGRILEVYGPESSGKTTLCLQAIAQSQSEGGTCAFIDVEHALDSRYAAALGINLEDLLVSQPDCGEDALNIAEALIRSNAVDVVVVDSVAALVSKKELEGEFGDSTVGLQARLMSQAMRRLTGVISRSKCLCIFTNQIREKIGVMFGSPETQPGGRALKFFASQRIDIRRIGQIKETTGKVIGSRTRIKVVKNKVAPPFTECEVDVLFGKGICAIGSLLDLALEKKLIEKKGSWFTYEGEMLGQGRERAKAALEEDVALQDTLRAKLTDTVEAKVGEVMGKNDEEYEPLPKTPVAPTPSQAIDIGLGEGDDEVRELTL